STFNGDATFGYSAFNGTAYFGDSAFNVYAYFGDSAFNDTANFGESAFNCPANFDDSAFNGDAYFGDSAFNGTAYFWNSAFNGDAIFVYSAFNGTAYFGDSTFNGDATFGYSAFNGDAYFISSAFNGTTDFGSSAFNGTTDFVEAEFFKESSFDDSQFNGTTSFNNSRFKEDALFEGSDFNCTLYLIRTKYEKMFIRWSGIKDLAYDDAAYLSLMDNFKKLGYLEDYDNCYYEYRKEHRDRDWGGKYHGMSPVEERIRKHIDAGLEIFYGYGKKPLYPLGWAIGTVLLFGIAWWIGGLETHNDKSRKDLRKGIIEKYGSGKKTGPKNQSKGRDWRREIEIPIDAMIFSATIFLSGTRLFVDPPKLPELPRWSKSTTKFVFTAERVLGAFFSILFFLAIGATVIR
ncbi:MAG TPA: pentapeptide repeat-containing protein, partial [Methanothrix sp.]|nr:pentapeptide repeat-containing protein [Methanothrix sp.]HPS91012.1 pentapeptide repeat-containing protein [Methanothrix sp.]